MKVKREFLNLQYSHLPVRFSDKQTSTPLRGESFMGTVYGMRHTVTYEAKDQDGLSGFCSFHFKVTGKN